MGRVLDALSWLVTVRPVATLAVLAAITITLGAGIPQRAPQANNEIFLSDDSEVAVALSTIEALFGESAETVSVTLVFRGEALTPEGLAQIDGVIEGVTSDERVADVLTAGDAVTSPTEPLAVVLGVEDFGDTTQAEVDRVLERIRTEGDLQEAQAVLDTLTGRDADGTPIAIATIRLRDPGDVEALVEAELTIHEIAEAVEGPLAASSVSPATIDEESGRGHGLDDAAVDGARAAGDRGADLPLHALALGPIAHAVGAARHDRVDHGGRRGGWVRTRSGGSAPQTSSRRWCRSC